MKIVWNSKGDLPIPNKNSYTIVWGTVFTGSVFGTSSLYLTVSGVTLDLKDPFRSWNTNVTVENYKEVDAAIHVDAAEE